MQPVRENLEVYIGTIWERNNGPYDKIFFELIGFDTEGICTFRVLKTRREKGNPEGTDMEGTNPNQDKIFCMTGTDNSKNYKGGYMAKLPISDKISFLSPMTTKQGNMGRKGRLPTDLCTTTGPYYVHPQGWTPGRRTNYGMSL